VAAAWVIRTRSQVERASRSGTFEVS